jgi:hypothetical protein
MVQAMPGRSSADLADLQHHGSDGMFFALMCPYSRPRTYPAHDDLAIDFYRTPSRFLISHRALITQIWPSAC